MTVLGGVVVLQFLCYRYQHVVVSDQHFPWPRGVGVARPAQQTPGSPLSQAPVLTQSTRHSELQSQTVNSSQ